MVRAIPRLPSRRLPAVLATLLMMWGFAAPSRAEDPELSFNRDIHPILSDNCFQCHGPDSDQRQAGLRLDLREGAIAKAESGLPAIAPGDPSASELMHRISSDDPDVKMPPPDSKKSLTDDQKRKLSQWIQQGAAYESHWAFSALSAPNRPPLDRRVGPETRSISSSWRDWNATVCNPRQKPIAPH